MTNIIIGFVFGFLLIVASMHGNHAMFDAVPLGGWTFLILYLAFHLTFLTCVSAECPVGVVRKKHFTSNVLIYLFILIVVFPLSICLMSWFKWGWAVAVVSLACFIRMYFGIRKGGCFNLRLPEILLKKNVWVQLIWLIGFVAVVETAKSFDLLNGDFETSGIRLLAFNGARLLFVVYLGFALFQIGLWILSIGRKWCQNEIKIATSEYIILCTTFGGALATIILFILGLVHLYYTWLVLLIALPVVWNSGKWVLPAAETLCSGINLFFRRKSFFQAFPLCLLVAALLVGIVLTIIGKAIWPGDAGGDVYSHYLPYYREVIAKHSLEPNAVWYHYYVSKAAGLFFFAMLLIDELGGQLVTLLFHFISAFIIYDLVVRATKVCMAGLFAVLLFIYVYIPVYTWGIFLKHHELMGSGILFVIWFTLFLGRQKSLGWRNYALGGSLFSAAFAMQFPTAAALLVPLFCLAGLGFFLTKRFQAAKSVSLFALVGLIAIGVLIIFNQLQTGMGMETPARLFWKMANQQKFSQWVSPYLMVYLNEGSTGGVGTIISPFAKLINISGLAKLLRLDYLRIIYPLHFALIPITLLIMALIASYKLNNGNRVVIISLLVAFAWIISSIFNHPVSAKEQMIFISLASIVTFILFYPEVQKRIFAPRMVYSMRRQTLFDIAVVLSVVTTLAWVMANVVDQPVSIYRMFSFLCAISIVVGVTIWTFLLILVRRHLLLTITVRKVFTVGLLLTVVLTASSGMLLRMRENIHSQVKFALGVCDAEAALSSTVDPATRDSSAWPLYLRARKLVGPQVPILTFGINGNRIGTSFAFPGAGLQSEVSYSLGPKWHTIIFGNPEEAEDELRKQNINYFLVDWASEYLFGGVPFSPLFDPDELTKRFSLIADYGGIWLLGWKGMGGNPLTADEIQIWELVRNGCMSPLLDNRISDLLSSKILDIMSSPSDIHMIERLPEIAEQLKKEADNVLPVSLRPSTRMAITHGLLENITRIMQELRIERPKYQGDDSNWRRGVAMDISRVISESMAINIKNLIYSCVRVKNDEPDAEWYRNLQNCSVATKKMLGIYENVREIYMYNEGRTTNILRKPELPQVTGWQ